MKANTKWRLSGIMNHKDIEESIRDKFESVRKKFGLFFTPEEIIDIMVQISDYKEGKVLEPACGLGQFLARIAKRIICDEQEDLVLSDRMVGVEITKEIADRVNEYIYSYLSLRRITEYYGEVPVIMEDYLLSKLEPEFELIT